MSETTTYPLERDGRVVWACCESSIGGPCGHRAGMTAGEGDQAVGLVDEPEDQAATVEDSDGDVWERCGDGWWLPGAAGEVREWDDVVDRFGPLTLVPARLETLAELVQEWADQGGPLQEAMDRLDSTLQELQAPPMTETERAAVVARIEG